MDLVTKRLSLGLGLALSLVVVACAAPDVGDAADGNSLGGDQAATGGSKKTPKKTPKKTDTEAQPEGDPELDPTTTPTPDTTPTPTPTNCNQASPDACFDCCNQASGGAFAQADQAYGQCACGDTGQCRLECDASLCSGLGASAACQQCLTSVCEPMANALCTTAACKTGKACVEACPQ
jgi:hypothetical protein